ncbi:uncharacterized protein LOC141725026 isoform X2 [Apium graveolens]|uniref:uncharacterized protein LOC141725026 isoform X2 n=1 Tax=Apium graveolens TaxID=4045 RepID=UPI003D78D6AD
MKSSLIVPSSPLFLPIKTPLLNQRFRYSSSYPSLFTYFRPRNPIFFASSLQNLEVSWVSNEPNHKDDFNGWAVTEQSPIESKKKKGTFVLVGVGASVLALLLVFWQFSVSRKGFPFRSQTLRNVVVSSETDETIDGDSIAVDASSADVVPQASSESTSDIVDEAVPSVTNYEKREEEFVGRITVAVAVDSIQKESLYMLKKLKIVEDYVKADELCTRREYARWLARANLLLERKYKHKIVPSIALSGSTISAFDDVSVEDPDFLYIQSLAEAGIVLSKLSLDESNWQEGSKFFPERFISRQDLISWKAKLDYEVMPGLREEISRNNLGFMDVREINPDAIVVLFKDLLAGDKSIIRTVFGQGKRFQANKPCTTAQAAVALTSGRMEGAIHSELSRLEAECSLRKMAMVEIRSELQERGDIQKYWEKKFEEEKRRGVEVERSYVVVVQDFDQEKSVEENILAEYLKEKTAMDCQKQLLSSLKEEIDDMYEKLEVERFKYIDEQQSVQNTHGDLQAKYDGLLDTKLILEAEIEAVRILSYVAGLGLKMKRGKVKRVPRFS